jgi:hypothetical protein
MRKTKKVVKGKAIRPGWLWEAGRFGSAAKGKKDRNQCPAGD